MRRARWWAAISIVCSLAGAFLIPGSDQPPAPSVPGRAAVAATAPGSLDAVSVVAGGVELRGWVGGDAVGSTIHVRTPAGTVATTTADDLRPDLAVVDPAARAFSVTVPAPDGAHTVCADLERDDGSFVRLGCGASDPAAADAAHEALAEVVGDIGRAIESRIPGVTVGVAVVPFDTGRLAGWRENRLFISASTAKTWWVAAALAAGEAEAVADIVEPIFEDSNDFLSGEAMDLAGGIDAVNEFTESAGMADTGAMKWGQGSGQRFAVLHPGPLAGSNHVDPSDAALFFYRLGTNQLLPPAETELLAGWMRRSPRTTADAENEASMMTNDLPRRVRSATEHKAGWLAPERWLVDPHLLDTGIVRPRNEPAYALALMATGPIDVVEYAQLIRELQDASCEIYRHLADDNWTC